MAYPSPATITAAQTLLAKWRAEGWTQQNIQAHLARFFESHGTSPAGSVTMAQRTMSAPAPAPRMTSTPPPPPPTDPLHPQSGTVVPPSTTQTTHPQSVPPPPTDPLHPQSGTVVPPSSTPPPPIPVTPGAPTPTDPLHPQSGTVVPPQTTPTFHPQTGTWELNGQTVPAPGGSGSGGTPPPPKPPVDPLAAFKAWYELNPAYALNASQYASQENQASANYGWNPVYGKDQYGNQVIDHWQLTDPKENPYSVANTLAKQFKNSSEDWQNAANARGLLFSGSQVARQQGEGDQYQQNLTHALEGLQGAYGTIEGNRANLLGSLWGQYVQQLPPGGVGTTPPATTPPPATGGPPPPTDPNHPQSGTVVPPSTTPPPPGPQAGTVVPPQTTPTFHPQTGTWELNGVTVPAPTSTQPPANPAHPQSAAQVMSQQFAVTPTQTPQVSSLRAPTRSRVFQIPALKKTGSILTTIGR